MTNTPKMNQTVEAVNPLHAVAKSGTTPKTASRIAPRRPVTPTGSVSKIHSTTANSRMPSDMMPWWDSSSLPGIIMDTTRTTMPNIRPARRLARPFLAAAGATAVPSLLIVPLSLRIDCTTDEASSLPHFPSFALPRTPFLASPTGRTCLQAFPEAPGRDAAREGAPPRPWHRDPASLRERPKYSRVSSMVCRMPTAGRASSPSSSPPCRRWRT